MNEKHLFLLVQDRRARCVRDLPAVLLTLPLREAVLDRAQPTLHGGQLAWDDTIRVVAFIGSLTSL